jgi:hypothetical protein
VSFVCSVETPRFADQHLVCKDLVLATLVLVRVWSGSGRPLKALSRRVGLDQRI